MKNRIEHPVLLTLLAALLVSIPLAVSAQDDPLAAEAALLEGTAKAKEKSADDSKDPNPKLLAEVHTARKALEKRINHYQKAAAEFMDLDEGLHAATQKMFKASEGFFSKHGKMVADFANAGANDATKKLKTNIEKHRKAFLKTIKAVNKDLDKLQKLEKKLRDAVAKEDAEAAKAAAANQEAGEDGNEDGNEGTEGDSGE